ncbi:Glycosyltransferase involved in cell wall bisynthesis [Mucilaginibacter xinganensis]|uniref:Glycosyltransferase involved in cell wall bisynthesis n=1 Tax=Mucilaginibacter xinganensis TaxID=1234841 RepID=A0A223NVI7_9SPHI|nr:Glycosyltransferase involved in cell wall bisynthesis [Mucilaginibacter xinganensis]
MDSITEDSYPNKEIVIINDGSKDDTDGVIINWVKLNQNKISVIYVKRENRGICATLNELIRLSNGKYLLVIASDDALYGNTIAERVDLLEETEKNGKLVLVSDAQVIDENNNFISASSMEMNKGDKNKFKTEEGILEELISKPSTVGAIALINKSIYSRIGFYPEDTFIEDWFFYQRAASIRAILFWDKVVSQYRVHSSNMSGSNISLTKRLLIYRAVKLSVRRNVSWFPSLYFKYLGVKKIIELDFAILKLTLKNYF